MSTHQLSPAQIARQDNRHADGEYAEGRHADPGQDVLDPEPSELPSSPVLPQGTFAMYRAAEFEPVPYQQTMVRSFRATLAGGQAMFGADWRKVEGPDVQPGDVIRVQAIQIDSDNLLPREFEGQVRAVGARPWINRDPHGQPADWQLSPPQDTAVFTFADGTQVQALWPFTDVLLRQPQGELEVLAPWTAEQHQADLDVALSEAKDRLAQTKRCTDRDLREEITTRARKRLADVKAERSLLKRGRDVYVAIKFEERVANLSRRPDCDHSRSQVDLHGISRCAFCDQKKAAIQAAHPVSPRSPK